MERKVLEISWGSLWRVLFFLIFVSILFLGRQALLGLFLAIIISSGLESVVDFLEKKRIPRVLGVVILFLFLALIFTIVIYAVVPIVIVDINNVFSDLSKLSKSKWWGSFLGIEFDSITDLINRTALNFFAGDVSPIEFFAKLLGGFGLVAAVIISSFYLSLTRNGVERFILAVFPADAEEAALRIYERSRKKIGAWFRMQIFLSLIMGILVWLALWLLGVEHSFLLGALAAVFELAPYVGPILSGAASFISAFSTSLALSISTLIVFLALHQLESHILVPLFTKRAVGLHPVIVIVSLLIGLNAAGFLGLIIAVPAAAVFQEVIEDWSGRKKLREAVL